MNWSPYQTAVFSFPSTSPNNLMISAVAGSGKTTTIVELASRLDGSVSLVAFNKHIAETLQTRLTTPNARACTIHSAGFSALRTRLRGRFETVANKYTKLALAQVKSDRDLNPLEILGQGARDWDLATVLSDLADEARLTFPLAPTAEALATSPLLESINPAYADFIAQYVAEWLLPEGAAQADKSNYIDFTDMIWLPLRWNLTPDQSDWLLVDEAQDLNPAQALLTQRMLRPNGRFVGVGDPRQAIMQFAHASESSFEDLQRHYTADLLPLSVCYRCPTSVIALAQQIVPSIEPAPNAPAGVVDELPLSTALAQIRPDIDTILCRTNKPLVSLAMKLIRQSRPAYVRGRSVGVGLGKILTRLENDYNLNPNLANLPEALIGWYQTRATKLRAKAAPREAFLTLQDQADSIAAITDNLPTRSLSALRAQLDNLFSDQTAKGKIVLSSIHRAKGLEADRVFILEPQTLTTDTAPEANLKYVALTRAKQHLTFVI